MELFNAWSAPGFPDPGPSFGTLRERKFTRRTLLEVFTRFGDLDDLDRLDRLVHNRHFAERIPLYCLANDGERVRAWLLDLLRHWEAPGEDPPGKYATAFLPTLRRWKDEAFRREAGRILAERFPDLPALE